MREAPDRFGALTNQRAIRRALIVVAVPLALVAVGCRTGVDDGPQPITPARGDDLEVTFAGRVIVDFEELDGWAFATYPEGVDGYLTQSFGDQPVHAGQYSARLVYDFTGVPDQTAAAIAETAVLLSLNWQELSLMVYGDGSGHRLRAEFIDSAGVKYAGDLSTSVNWRGSWRECRLAQEALVPVAESGARRRPPLALTRIYLLVLPDGDHNAGEVYLDTMTLR